MEPWVPDERIHSVSAVTMQLEEIFDHGWTRQNGAFTPGSTRVSRVGFGVAPNPAAGRAEELQMPVSAAASPRPPASGATPEATQECG